MRAIQRTEYVGELLGPVDWSYDFTQHDWRPNRGGVNPECAREGAEALRIIEAALAAGKAVTVRRAHCSRRPRVIAVGMYDGWPFWRPTPAVLVEGPLGGEWEFFYSIRDPEVQP